MASFADNINTIETAVYGKEMRPAIAEALMQSHGALTALAESVNQLSARVDALPNSGGGGGESGGGGEDNPGGITVEDSLIPPTLVVYGTVTLIELIGALPASV